MRLRFSSLLAVTLLWATAAHAAPARTFDVIQFSPPDGFEIDDKSADHVSMSNTAPGRFGVIAVYTGRPATGDLLADFKVQWKEAVEHMMQPQTTPEPIRGTLPGGGAVLAGDSDATMDGKDVHVRLFVLDGGAKVVSIAVVTPGADLYDRYADTVGAMLATATVAQTAPPPATVPPAPLPQPPAGGAKVAPGSGAKAAPGSGAKAAPGAGAKVAPPPPPPAYKPVPLAADPALPAAPAVDKKQLVGEWRHSTGRPADKDSVIYGDIYTLTAKGKFELRYIARTGADVLREDDAGGYAYKDGRLLLLNNKRGTVVLHVAGWKDDKSATTLTLLPDGFPATEGNAKIFGQDWVRAKGKGKGKGKR